MVSENVPEWILSLDIEELEFIRNFILKSGSLKEIAKNYNVSYPTVRIRLDRLIQKIELSSEMENGSFINFIKQLAIDDRISLEDAKLLIDKYKIESGAKKNE